MTDLVPYQDRTIQSYQDMESVAKAMVASEFFSDTRKTSQAIVKIMAGREVGVGPFTSMNGIHIIKGKPAFGANIMAAKVKQSGRYNYRVTEMTDQACSIEFYELFNNKWEKSGTSTFTLADAKKAGTQNLDKFARNMLFARAMSNGVRWYCPDVMNGSTAYTPEELGAPVDGDGVVIEAPFEFTPREPQVEEIEEAEVIEEPEFVEPTTQPPMTIEAACKVTTSEGKAYGAMSQIGLEKMLSAMHKRLKTNHLSDTDKAELEHKIKAAQIVHAAKVSNEIS